MQYVAERRVIGGGNLMCSTCWDHASSPSMQKDAQHTEMWRLLLAEQKRRHEHAVEVLEEGIAGLRRDLEERPEKEVLRYVDADVLAEAKSEADRAFRSRTAAWQALVMVRLLHREVEQDRCKCGARLDRCEVAKIVDRYPALRRWELEQVERFRAKETHALPEGYPALIDPRWRHPDEDPIDEDELYPVD